MTRFLAGIALLGSIPVLCACGDSDDPRVDVSEQTRRLAEGHSHDGCWFAVDRTSGRGVLFSTGDRTDTQGTRLHDLRLVPVESAMFFNASIVSGYVNGVHAIGVKTDSTDDEDLYRIEAIAVMSPQTRWAPVLGPSGAASRAVEVPRDSWTSGALVLTTRNGIVASHSTGYLVPGWVLIWDSRARRTLWDGSRRSVPFLALLDSHEEPDRDEVGRLTSLAETLQTFEDSALEGHRMSLPSERDLLAALRDPRPSVESAARSILEAGGSRLYPRAAEVLGASELPR